MLLRKNVAVLIAMFGSFSGGCGSGSEVKDESSAPAVFSGPEFLTPHNLTNDKWSNGILRKDGRTNQFYFIIDKDDPITLKVGDRLTFAKAGQAAVIKVESLLQNNKLSVFVTVDKDLDPEGDGYPKRIIVE